MKLKKLNAALSLLTILLALLHIGCSVYMYLTFTYAPFLKQLFSIPLISAVCLHAVLGMCAVFLLGEAGGPVMYPRLNRRTILQRLSAALFFPLLILHLRTFDLLQSSAGNDQWGAFGLLIAVQVLFYGVVILHMSVSLTRALITLGWLSSRKTQRTLDRIIFILGALVFIIAAVSVIRTQIIMFAL